MGPETVGNVDEAPADVLARGRGEPLAPQGRQMQVMSVLWQLGSGSVAEVQRELNLRYEPEIAYNTALTYLRTLRSRRWVRVVAVGRAHRYYPAVSLEHARWLEIERITDLLYGAERESLLIDLVTDPCTPPRALARARLALEERLASPAAR